MKTVIIMLLYLAAAFHGFSQEKDEMMKEWLKMSESKTPIYKDFNDLKFGMFIHWGAYSRLGGTWKGKRIPDLGEWIMYHAQIPRQEYREVCKAFNPTDFNAEEWVKLAKDAGMKYIVAMTKHHDGFSMYRSKVTNFNIYDYTPFRRDPIEEIYKACKKYGIRLGLYYSHSIDWMDGGDAGNAQYKKEHAGNTKMETEHNEAEMEAANIWDPSPETYDDYIAKKAKPQMQEILTKFPGLIEVWYDYPIYMSFQQSFDFYKLAYDIQPNCLINERVGNGLGDILTAGDNEIPTENRTESKPFETPGTLNDTWGYKSYDNHWKSPKEILFWIAEIASKGGNYLLNVGPDGSGIIPEESVKILEEVGAWMHINGEAIYGTHYWTTRKEGPTKTEMVGGDEDGNIKTESGEKFNFDFSFTPEDFWFTAKDNYVYVISLATQVSGTISVKSLFDYRQKIKSITILGSHGFLKWKALDEKVNITLPLNKKTEDSGFVLKVELK
jgi:alpha-L-fucosidase